MSADIDDRHFIVVLAARHEHLLVLQEYFLLVVREHVDLALKLLERVLHPFAKRIDAHVEVVMTNWPDGLVLSLTLERVIQYNLGYLLDFLNVLRDDLFLLRCVALIQEVFISESVHLIL